MMAGALRHRVTIEEPANAGRGGYGGAIKNWVPWAQVWAEVKPLKGEEYFEAQAAQSEVTHTVFIRFLDGVRPKMRINHGGRILNIKSIINPQERGKYLQIMCAEVAE